MSKKKYPRLNRELSWLAFNRRVLYQAQSRYHPLLERLKFIAIFSSNLDEFFMVRMAGLAHQIDSSPNALSPDGLTPYEQLKRIRQIVKTQLALRQRIFYTDILPKLEEHGIQLKTCAELSEIERNAVEKFFDETIFPTLTPLAVDPGHPFPYLSNLSLSLAVKLHVPDTGEYKFARVKVPSNLPRLINIEELLNADNGDGTEAEKQTFVWSEDIMSTFANKLFPNLDINCIHLFRITRDTDLEIEEDEAHDLLETVSESLWQQRYGKVLKLDISTGMPDDIKKILTTNLEVTSNEVYTIEGILGASVLWELYHAISLPKLKDPPLAPKRDRLPAGANLFSIIEKQDKLLYHPFNSFEPVVEFIQKAAVDPDVIAIKQTLYRVGSKSPVVDALAEAARQGKQVAVVLELKARFDEENNIVWAKKLEQEGVHVIYGLLGLKVHAKMLLIVRKHKNEIKRYVHLGTGNYNLSTAKVYTDYSFFTTDKDIAHDVTDIFNYLTGYSKQIVFRTMLVSPINMREQIIKKIRREADIHGEKGRIIFKMNSLVDEEVITELYKASEKGVKIDLIVRGVSTLLPKVEGISSNIRVISIIGQFLEHSRVYYFDNDGEDELYLGSADMMERNLDRRVEALFPITEPSLKEKIKNHLELILKDNQNAWELLSTGFYKRIKAVYKPSMLEANDSYHRD